MLNTWWIYLIVGLIFVYVLAQSFYVLITNYKEAKALGFESKTLKDTITSAFVFSIAPSIAILIGLITLSKIFGPMVSAMRLGTLGAVTYELPAALNVITGVYKKSVGDPLSHEIVVTALWVMTFGCIPPLLIIPFYYEKLEKRLKDLKERDQKWNEILMDSLFLGMISAFIGYVIAPKTDDLGNSYISLLSILTFLSSAGIIGLFGLLVNKKRFKFLRNYALPLSMVMAMALAILYFYLGVK